jgi:glucose-6-phosphate 1-dehydrogenase
LILSKTFISLYDVLMTPTRTSPTAIVIFGGTGNLAETKLFPALFHLYAADLLPETFLVIGLSRKKLSDSEYQNLVAEKILAKLPTSDRTAVETFCTHLRYTTGDFTERDAYTRIKDQLIAFDTALNLCTSKLFYLAVPPSLYQGIFENLEASQAMSTCNGVDAWSRILVEKPFGSDQHTAAELEAQLCALFPEDHIYRIDHYLAKDTIENIMSLRFANSILSDSWSGNRIESISLRLFEAQDVSTRGAFYDSIGALRDVGQNHLLQMLALLTMRPTDIHDPAAVRESRLAAVSSLRMHDTDLRYRAQYTGYRDTPGVDPASETETYFKISTHIDSELWKDVSVTMESGKALHASFTDATITFRPLETCRCAALPSPHHHRNVLRITFSPEHQIRLTMWVKKPGFDFTLEEQELVLDARAGEVFRSPEAYERVLYDCIIGDQTRFVSGAEVAAAWKFITPLLSLFKNLPLHQYEKGSSSPVASD